MEYHDDILDIDIGQVRLDQESIMQINRTKTQIDTELEKIRKGRNTLFFLVGYVALGVLVSLYFNPFQVSDATILLEGLIMMTLYGTFGLLVKWHPLASLSTGLGTFILYHLIIALLDPSVLINGLVIKILILFFLGSGIEAAWNVKKQHQKLRRLGVWERELDLVKELELSSSDHYLDF